MADMTNITDTLLDGSTVTSLVDHHDHGGRDSSTRFGKTHTSWHRGSSSIPPDTWLLIPFATLPHLGQMADTLTGFYVNRSDHGGNDHHAWLTNPANIGKQFNVWQGPLAMAITIATITDGSTINIEGTRTRNEVLAVGQPVHLTIT